MPMTTADDSAARTVTLPPGVTIEAVFALREELAARSARANRIVAEASAERRVFLRSPDEVLAAASRDGDEDALSELRRRYRGTVLRLVQANTDYSRPSDLVGEVFDDMREHIGEFTGDSDGEFGCWLTEVIVPPVIEHRTPR
jgi:hypothetical protein